MIKVEFKVTNDGDGENQVVKEISMNSLYDDFVTWMEVMRDLQTTLGASFGYELKDDDDK